MIKLRQSATRPLNFGSAVEATATRPVLGRRLRDLLFILLTTTGLSGPVVAQEAALGANLPDLLAHARAQSPELRAMQAEADAEAMRIESRYTDEDLLRLIRAHGIDESLAPGAV